MQSGKDNKMDIGGQEDNVFITKIEIILVKVDCVIHRKYRITRVREKITLRKYVFSQGSYLCERARYIIDVNYQ